MVLVMLRQFLLIIVCAVLFMKEGLANRNSNSEKKAIARTKGSPLSYCVVSITSRHQPNCTGTIILPTWFITDPNCLKGAIQQYTITGKRQNNDYYVTSVKNRRAVTVSYRQLVSMGQFKQRTPLNSPIVAIATRFDAFIRPTCFVYASLNTYLVKIYKTTLIPMKECAASTDQKRGYLVCAKVTESACFEPGGSSLVCDNRIVGIRYDNKPCPTKFYIFLNVPNIDADILRGLSLFADGISNEKIRVDKDRNMAPMSVRLIDFCLYVWCTICVSYSLQY